MRIKGKNLLPVGICFLVLLLALLYQVIAQTGGAEYNHRRVRYALEAYFVDHNAYPPWEYKDYGRGKKIATFKNTALTTPIAYLPRMPIDIFSYDENHWYSYYCINDIEKDGKKKGKKRSGKKGWIIISAGPDQDYDVDAPKVYDIYSTATLPILINLEYDATNGTISNGDLITCSEWEI